MMMRGEGGGPGGGPGMMMRGGGRDRRGGRGGGPPMGGMPMGGQPGGESSEDRFARFEGMLRGFDANKDGVIDPKEVPEDRRRFLGFIGERMGVDFGKPVSIDKLREKATEKFGGESNSKAKKEPEPLVPGFGIEQEEPVVLAFGQREAEEASSAGGGASGGGGGSEGQGNSRAEGMVRMLLGRFDHNRNGVLEKDEWKNIPGEPWKLDRNRDGKLDKQEIIARFSPGWDGGVSGDSEDDSRRSYDPNRKSWRFLSAAERLPEGLPDWFAERDGNADGQVTMAEYSSYWSDGKAREYLKFDLNDDGVITPRECLDAMSQPDFESPVVSTSTPDATEGEGESPADAKPEEKEEESGEKPWWME